MVEDTIFRVFGEDVADLRFIGGGGNSRVSKVVLASGKSCVVKSYYSQCADWQERMDTEFNAYGLLRQNNIESVPVPIAKDEQSKSAVYSFEDGRRVCTSDPFFDGFELFVKFAGELFYLSKQKQLADYKMAKASSLKHDALENQILRRIKILSNTCEDSSIASEMLNFFRDDFVPFFSEICIWRNAKLKEAGKGGYFLQQGEWTLSPSDFGLHNALMRDDGSFVFVDFEYFGRDDPAKMVADFLLHPAMDFSAHLRGKIVEDFGRIFDDEFYILRLNTLLPLVGLKWCMIFLNEFLPHGAGRRAFASGQAEDINAVRRRQLEKTYSLFAKIRNGYEGGLDAITT